MKKQCVKAMILTGVLIGSIGLAGCSKNEALAPDMVNNAEEYSIGISQLVEHPSLDQARQGFIDGLKELGIKANIEEKNAQAEPSNAQLIAEKYVKDKVDLIYSIATISTQTAKKATENTDIPVIFNAVTDPIYSQIVNDLKNIDGNITGVTDNVSDKNIEELFEAIRSLKNDKNAIGIVYNTGESNSEVQVEAAKRIAKSMGMSIETVGITSVNDITQAVQTLSQKVDGLYITSDNLVATAIPLVSKIALENNLITVTAVEAYVSDGIMLANGISYYGLGKQAATIAKKILVDKEIVKNIPIEECVNLSKSVNAKTIEALKLDKENVNLKDAKVIE